jgi:hypothetical protein
VVEEEEQLGEESGTESRKDFTAGDVVIVAAK